MAEISYMVEAIREVDQTDEEVWRPGIVWTKGNRIVLASISAFATLQADYEAKLSDARSRGFSEDALWDYWTQNTGGYEVARTSPQVMVADSQEEAIRTLLKRVNGRYP